MANATQTERDRKGEGGRSAEPNRREHIEDEGGRERLGLSASFPITVVTVQRRP